MTDGISFYSREIVLGVDIGGTKLLGVALDVDNRVVAEARLPTPPAGLDAHAGFFDDKPGVTIADAVQQVAKALRAQLPSSGGDGREHLGVGVPGMLDSGGVLRFSPHLLGGVGADFATLLSGDGEGARSIENDANCAAVAERALGSAGGAQEAMVVTLGTGIGGGLIHQGELVRGAHGFAGEIGHMVVDPSGPPCPCGRNGCWERYASGGGLGRLAREAAYAGRLQEVVALAGGDPEDVRGEHVTRAAVAGDPGAQGVMADLGWWLALGLANITAILDLELFVIGGGLAEAGECLLAPTREAFADLVEGGASRPPVRIVAAALGERAGAIGAALNARCEVRS